MSHNYQRIAINLGRELNLAPDFDGHLRLSVYLRERDGCRTNQLIEHEIVMTDGFHPDHPFFILSFPYRRASFPLSFPVSLMIEGIERYETAHRLTIDPSYVGACYATRVDQAPVLDQVWELLREQDWGNYDRSIPVWKEYDLCRGIEATLDVQCASLISYYEKELERAGRSDNFTEFDEYFKRLEQLKGPNPFPNLARYLDPSFNP